MLFRSGQSAIGLGVPKRVFSHCNAAGKIMVLTLTAWANLVFSVNFGQMVSLWAEQVVMWRLALAGGIPWVALSQLSGSLDTSLKKNCS